MLAKFACANLATKCFAVNLLNFGVGIYLLWSGISFSTVVRALVIAKLVMQGILSLISFLIALREALAAKFVILGI